MFPTEHRPEDPILDKLTIFPTALKRGARVALVSPAGPITADSDLERAQQNARSLGWEPVIGKHAAKQTGYLAGADNERLEDLNSAIANDRVDGIWCVRGGYGSMRLLDQIDYASLAKSRKPVIGYSDITALHSAIWRRCRLVTFHGPTAREQLSDFSRASLLKAVVERVDPCGAAPAARELKSGRATGRLAGGNLALLSSLVGTPYSADLAGAILVLEDVNEPLYRVDRMLHQLLLAGALSKCKAIVFGDCTGVEGGKGKGEGEGEGEDGATSGLDQLLQSVATKLRIPCLAGIPVGHVAEQWTIPLGATAKLDTAARTLTVNFKEAIA